MKHCQSKDSTLSGHKEERCTETGSDPQSTLERRDEAMIHETNTRAVSKATRRKLLRWMESVWPVLTLQTSPWTETNPCGSEVL